VSTISVILAIYFLQLIASNQAAARHNRPREKCNEMAQCCRENIRAEENANAAGET